MALQKEAAAVRFSTKYLSGIFETFLRKTFQVVHLWTIVTYLCNDAGYVLSQAL